MDLPNDLIDVISSLETSKNNMDNIVKQIPNFGTRFCTIEDDELLDHLYTITNCADQIDNVIGELNAID